MPSSSIVFWPTSASFASPSSASPTASRPASTSRAGGPCSPKPPADGVGRPLGRAASSAGGIEGGERDKDQADGGPAEVADHEAPADRRAEALGDPDKARERGDDGHDVAGPPLPDHGARMRR